MGQAILEARARRDIGADARLFVQRLALIGAVLALLFGVQLFLNARINLYVQQIIILSGVNIILAVSLNLINGITGQFSLGHAGFMAIGAYGSAYLTREIGPKLIFSDGPIFVLALLLAAGGAGLAGYIVGLPSLRLRGDYLAIVTLGFGQIIIVLIRTTPALGEASGFNNIPRLTNFTWTFALVIACIVMMRNLADSALGRSMRAVRDDEVAAEAAGINTTQVKVLAFVISAAWAGVAGALQAHYLSLAHPNDFTFFKSIEVVVMVVLGGLGSITGVTITAVLLTALVELLRDVRMAFYIALTLIAFAALLSLPRHREAMRQNGLNGALKWLIGPIVAAGATFAAYYFAHDWFAANVNALRYILYALILIVLMLLRPQGLLGRAELSRALFRRKDSARGRSQGPEPADEAVSGAL